MNCYIRCAAVAAISVAAQSQSFAQLQDLFITNSAGVVYQLNGQTLQATELFQLQDAGLINEIMYMGDGQLIANLTFAVASYDMNTNTQTTLFTSQQALGSNEGIANVAGLALQSDGNLYYTAKHFTQAGSFNYGGLYDMNTQTNSLIAGSDAGTLYADHFELSPGRMLGANPTSQSIDIFDPTTGAVEAAYSVGSAVASFVESNDELYILSSAGDIFTFDYTNGDTEFYGSINGTTGNLIGMTVPAPSSLAFMGLGLGALARRRR